MDIIFLLGRHVTTSALFRFKAKAKASPKRPITEVDNEKLNALNNELHSSKEALAKSQDEMRTARQKHEDIQGYVSCI